MLHICNTEEHLKRLNGMDPIYILRYLKAVLMDRLEFIYGTETVESTGISTCFQEKFFLNMLPSYFRYSTTKVPTELTGSWLGMLLFLMSANRLPEKPQSIYDLENVLKRGPDVSGCLFPESELPLITLENCQSVSAQKYPECSVPGFSWVKNTMSLTDFTFTNPLSPPMLAILLNRLDILGNYFLPFYTDLARFVKTEFYSTDAWSPDLFYRITPYFSGNYRVFIVDTQHEFVGSKAKGMVLLETGTISGTVSFDIYNMPPTNNRRLILQPEFPDRFAEMFD